jgi:peptidoglycan/LPS O-acetylase OafA/YrhL
MGLIRLLLAVAVVLNHAAVSRVLPEGRIAVQLFYMISGFLISYILIENKTYTKVSRFYLNRALRLFPAYYAVAGLTALFLIGFGSRTEFMSLPLIPKAFITLTNLLLFGQDWVMFTRVEGAGLAFTSNFKVSEPQLWQFLLVPQAWTLGVELTFYVLAPFIIRNKRILLGLLVASIGARLIAIHYGIGRTDPWNYRFFPFELALFLCGALSHQYLLPVAARVIKKAKRADIALTCGFLAVCIYSGIRPFPSIMVFASAFVALPFLFLFQENYKLDQKIGELSYPTYIGHLLVLFLLTHIFHLRPGSLAFVALAVVGAIAFAQILITFVISPVEKVRSAIKRGGGLRSHQIKLAGVPADGLFV